MATRRTARRTARRTVEKVVDGMYKGYNVRWLKSNPDHPDYYLVAEAEALEAETEE